MAGDFTKLREQLELQEWPGVYLFKFIVPNELELTARVTALFNDAVDLTYHPSKTGKYMSIGAKEMMMDVDSIISKYKQAAEIPGLIAL